MELPQILKNKGRITFEVLMLVLICRRPKEQTSVYAFIDKIYHQCKIADGTQPNAMERTRDRYRNRDAASEILLLSGAGAIKSP